MIDPAVLNNISGCAMADLMQAV